MWLINNEILFNPESRTLENKGKVTLQLNASASRCLSLFLSNPGDVISREALLKEGWGNQGVLVTDNSLRQVLSTLRKQFSHFNIEGDLFVTMHRKGYRLNEDIIVKKLIPVIETHDEKPLGVLDANKLSNVKARSYWYLFNRRWPDCEFDFMIVTHEAERLVVSRFG
ncbi:winged helix-turn-helix domain-containing protein [Pantoea dispersa]|uniref:winged helix-turn-helix domain-containing protein n=1 Tax=Pantoea dispersa TaxID=59814 RepID=UPI001BA8AD8C|nr:winged helix-turn-helix domain-containing protein [Pantoea dispersa]MBS0906211.1 winged helix-turn-helix domain-containing protein [Pantoea dispersa]